MLFERQGYTRPHSVLQGGTLCDLGLYVGSTQYACRSVYFFGAATHPDEAQDSVAVTDLPGFSRLYAPVI